MVVYVAFTVQFVTNHTGNTTVAVYKGYTYSRGGRSLTSSTWRCSRGCKARFTYGENGVVYKAQLKHDHEPPSFVIKNGIYIRL